jgi:hypothetical protein
LIEINEIAAGCGMMPVRLPGGSICRVVNHKECHMAVFRSANVGMADRAVRYLLAVLLVVAAYAYLAEPWSYVAYAATLILAVTAIVRFCPAYALFGASTCRTPRAH